MSAIVMLAAVVLILAVSLKVGAFIWANRGNRSDTAANSRGVEPVAEPAAKVLGQA